MPATEFENLQATLASDGPNVALDRAAQLLREQKNFHELFEVLKMQLRLKLGTGQRRYELAPELAAWMRINAEAIADGMLSLERQLGQ